MCKRINIPKKRAEVTDIPEDISDLAELMLNSETNDGREFFHRFRRYYLWFTVLEILLFIIFLTAGIITVVSYFTYDIYEIFEFFYNPPFLITVISGTLFLILPYFIKWIALKGHYFIRDIKINTLKSKFTERYGNLRAFDLEKIADEWKLEYDDVRRVFEELNSEGIIRGTLEGHIFKLADGFEIKPEKLLYLEKFRKNIVEYVRPYRWLSLERIARNFKLPVDTVREEIRKLITERKILGFLDGDMLVRELSVVGADISDLPECPYCGNKVLAHSRFCSHCGKRIDFDRHIEDSDRIF